MNNPDMPERKLNAYPFLRDFLIAVMTILLALSILNINVCLFKSISYILLSTFCGLAIYVVILVRVWRCVVVIKLLASVLSSVFIVLLFVFGLVNVFYGTHPGAANVMPISEFLSGYVGLLIASLMLMIVLTTIIAISKVAIIYEPVPAKSFEWWITAAAVVLIAFVSYYAGK